MAGLRQIVNPPTFTPLPYNLLSVVDQPPTTDNHWQNGISFQSHCVTGMGALTYDECLVVTGTGGSPPAPASKTGNVQTVNRGATPFTVYVEFDCSAVGSFDEASDIGARALAQVESWQVERALWTGQIDGVTLVFPHLAATTTVLDAQDFLLQSVPVTGGSGTTDVADGLGQLEAALADCLNGVGVIHVPVEAIPSLDAYGLVKPQGARLKTLNGNWVVAGAGYPGTSPSGASPAVGTTWMYATGPIIAYRGSVTTFTPTESFDRLENTVKMIAERTYVLAWDCCHAGVQVQLGTT